MLKKFLLLVAIVLASPTFALADDIFFAFGEGSAAANTSATTVDTGTGSVFIYSDGLFAFDAADILFTNSDASVIRFVGGEAFNPLYNVIEGLRFNDANFISDASDNNINDPATEGRLFLTNVTENGINPPASTLFDPLYNSEVDLNGASGAYLLARVDYDVVGVGTVDLDLSFGPQGAIRLDPPLPGEDGLQTIVLDPVFGSASLTVNPSVIPEPSSLALVMLGSVGLVTRRRRT